MSSVAVELARRQWEEGNRRLEEESSEDRTRQARLLAAQEAVLDELRRRIGQTFTLAELARAYERAEDWVREAIDEHAEFPGWPGDVTTVQDAAFHLYSRGATDYSP
jgi:hypothetical protein